MFQAAESERVVPTRLGRVQGLLGQNGTKTHRRTPRRAGARVCAGPLRASLPTPGSRALRRPRRGPALMPGISRARRHRRRERAGRPGVTRQQPGARRAGRGRDGGGASAPKAGRGGSRAQEALGGPSHPRVPRAAWTRAAAAIPLARGGERPARSPVGPVWGSA